MARRRTEGLAAVRDRLIRWRERHGGRGRLIPEELWAAAAAVAAVEGVDVTARVLGVDRGRLGRRVSRSAGTGTATATRRTAVQAAPVERAFVELRRVPSPAAGQSVVRLIGRDGEQVEIAGGVDVLTLVREFWNRARCSS